MEKSAFPWNTLIGGSKQTAGWKEGFITIVSGEKSGNDASPSITLPKSTEVYALLIDETTVEYVNVKICNEALLLKVTKVPRKNDWYWPRSWKCSTNFRRFHLFGQPTPHNYNEHIPVRTWVIPKNFQITTARAFCKHEKSIYLIIWNQVIVKFRVGLGFRV